jgi:hypothetical protein
MNENVAPFKNSKTSIIVFFLSLFVNGYWWLIPYINVYKYAFVGALFEILWLPILLLLFILPIISLILLILERHPLQNLYLYSILIGVTTILIMTLSESS